MSVASETIPPPSKVLLILEGRAIYEFGALLASLPLLRLAPKGDGRPVLVLPGFRNRRLQPIPRRPYLVLQTRQGRLI